jgi:DNA-directed RNA polymerase specialized sigma24 family protein
MHEPSSANTGFKRQVVFRVNAEEWPLLEVAAREHGSIQAAVLAGLRSLASRQSEGAAAHPPHTAKESQAEAPQEAQTEQIASSVGDPAEEITARDAAQILGLKTSTVSGYIRRGRLPGRYDEAPGWQGWLTTRAAIDAYRAR